MPVSASASLSALPVCCHLPVMCLSTRSYASDSSSPISISMLSLEIARLASLSASLFPLMPMWLGSQIKLIFLLYLRTKSKIYVRRFARWDSLQRTTMYMNRWICRYLLLECLWPKARLIWLRWVLPRILICYVNLTLCSMFNFGTQNAAEVLSFKVLDASV